MISLFEVTNSDNIHTTYCNNGEPPHNHRMFEYKGWVIVWTALYVISVVVVIFLMLLMAKNREFIFKHQPLIETEDVVATVFFGLFWPATLPMLASFYLISLLHDKIKGWLNDE